MEVLLKLFLKGSGLIIGGKTVLKAYLRKVAISAT